MDTLRLDLDHSLRDFSLRLRLAVGRETVALVGPSGAGKSSVLSAVAGLLRPEGNTIHLGDEPWLDAARGIDVPTERRSVGFVFQHYALFPHLTVRENVAFGGESRADELLERLRIAHLADQRPDALSGGEQQRVALARALARDPAVLLLDEPLSALDTHTKNAVRAELRELLGELSLPTLLVTHDFDDATALASRVGVLSEGSLLQLGSPAELVARPADAFVASLTGANLLPGVARPGRRGLTEVVLDAGGVVYSVDEATGRVGVAVFPWDVALARESPDDSSSNHISATVASIVAYGNRARVRAGPITAEITTASTERLSLREGTPVVASFKAAGTRLVPLE